MPEKTELVMIAETSAFMMSFVLLTKQGNAIIIDGGMPEDLPSLQETVGSHPVKAWFLTHPHHDHIGAFIRNIKDGEALRFERLYYNFPPEELLTRSEPVISRTMADFNKCLPIFADRSTKVYDGDVFEFDEISIRILQSYKEGEYINQNSAGNENSLVFMAETPAKKVLFLGDIGPVAGDRLYVRHWRDLKCDYVQVAHHGHSGPGAEVYLAANPEAALWCCRDWLYDEAPGLAPDVFDELSRSYGTRTTRSWLETMGVKKNYVTKDGTVRLTL